MTDAWPVMTEPFSQWVIEDNFPAGRPAWELEGAELVADVRPYELMKLRLLNGSHSCIAYLGYLAGHKTVSDAMADPVFFSFVRSTDGRGGDANPGRAARCRPDPLQGSLAGTVRQSRAEAQDMADRHGRFAEAAAAAARHDPRPAWPPANRSTASPSASPPGCAMSAASMNRASRSTSAIPWPTA